DALLHLRLARERRKTIDRHHDRELGRGATAPDNPGHDLVSSCPPQNDLLDQAAQQSLPMLPPRGRGCPQIRKAPMKGDDLPPKAGIDRGPGLRSAAPLSELVLRSPQFGESSLPPSFELACDQAIVGIHLVELTFGQ